MIVCPFCEHMPDRAEAKICDAHKALARKNAQIWLDGMKREQERRMLDIGALARELIDDDRNARPGCCDTSRAARVAERYLVLCDEVAALRLKLGDMRARAEQAVRLAVNDAIGEVVRQAGAGSHTVEAHGHGTRSGLAFLRSMERLDDEGVTIPARGREGSEGA